MEDNHKKIKKEECPHAKNIKITKSSKKECEVCKDKEHLRICTSCGFVGCCESHNSHDTEHFKNTDHPIIKPVNCDYDFTWCYECNAYLV
ncbi:UBP-type zinc finger domain-containing protein [Candidatus Woesearchaeota archaeon]|nr:UBP-type zinc finger domain-containing protein [Candidatus Woesearchaeota archaeon]